MLALSHSAQSNCTSFIAFFPDSICEWRRKSIHDIIWRKCSSSLSETHWLFGGTEIDSFTPTWQKCETLSFRAVIYCVGCVTKVNKPFLINSWVDFHVSSFPDLIDFPLPSSLLNLNSSVCLTCFLSMSLFAQRKRDKPAFVCDSANSCKAG